jgi:colanic acid biosynthesis glycosyl transferase WcaI
LNYCCFAMTALPLVCCSKPPDVVFVEAQPLPLGIVTLLLKLVRGVPYIYNVPDLQVAVARDLGFLRHGIVLFAAEQLESVLLMNAAHVSTVTRGFMKHFEDRGVPAARITFLPNGADTEFLKPSAPSALLIEEWGLKDKLIFVYVGTHAYYHGLDTLLEAAELLIADSQIEFVLVGNGPERERLRRLAEDKRLGNVLFASASYERMNDLYSIAYASIATLRDIPVADGMRLSKIFPALSCGVPVVYSGRGEAAELLKEHDCGIVVDPEAPAALAAAVKQLAADQSWRRRLGTNGRRYVENEYSWTHIVDRWLRV